MGRLNARRDPAEVKGAHTVSDYWDRQVSNEPRPNFYLWLRQHGVKHRWAEWICYPLERLRAWLYWRDILLLPWEGFGWQLNTKRNRLRRKLKEIEGKRFTGADA